MNLILLAWTQNDKTRERAGWIRPDIAELKVERDQYPIFLHACRHDRSVVGSAKFLIKNCVGGVSGIEDHLDEFGGQILVYLEFHFA